MTDRVSESETVQRPTRRRGWRLAAAAVGAAVAVLAAAVVAAPASGASTFVIFGQAFTLANGRGPWPANSTCTGTGVFSGVHQGSGIVVLDDTWATVGASSLGAGRADSSGIHCYFQFAVTVQAGRGHYRIQVAGWPGLRFSEAEMQRGPMALAVDISL